MLRLSIVIRAIGLVIILLGPVAAHAYPKVEETYYVQCDPAPDVPRGTIVEDIDVTLDSSGRISIQGLKVDEKRMLEYAKPQALERPSIPFMVTAKTNTPYGKFVSVVRALRKLGARQIFCSVW